MRMSMSSHSLQSQFNRLQNRIEIMESRQRTTNNQSKSKIECYSQIDNKENHQIQLKPTKYSYGAKYRMKQELHHPKHEEPDQPKVDLRKKLSVIFKFYASFGDRTNIDYLRSNKVHKLISDAQLRNVNGLENKNIDLLFVKANKNRPNMDFDNFVYFLELVADEIYGEGSLDHLIQLHLDPLYENIITSTDLGDEENKLQQPIDLLCVRLLQVLQSPLQAIYNKYFPPHFKSFQLKDTSEDFKVKSQTKSQLFQFLKDFDLCPQLLTKGTACLLYDSILEDSNLPEFVQRNPKQKLDFNRFCSYLAKLANISIASVDQTDKSIVPPIQKLAYILERMELSQGYLQLDVPSSNFKNWKLKVPEDILEIIYTDPENALQYLQNQTQRIKVFHVREDDSEVGNGKRMSTAPSKQASRHSVAFNITKQFETQSQQLFQEYYQELYNVYRQYAGVNNLTGYENELLGSKWLKILKDAGLVSTSCADQHNQILIPHTEVDLIFAKAIQLQQPSSQAQARGGSMSRKVVKQTMNFLQFMRGLQLASKDIKILEVMLKEHLLRLTQGGQNETRIKDLLGTLMQILKDKEIVEFLGLLHKSIIVYYKYYAGNKNLMNFDQFQKFYKDFQIFPDLLTKQKVIAVFQILSKLYEQNQECKSKAGVIDQHMFVESLALAALEVQFNDQDQISQLEKICYLVERINQSEGPKIVQKQLGHTKCPSGQDWDLLHNIRKRFAWLFQNGDNSTY